MRRLHINNLRVIREEVRLGLVLAVAGMSGACWGAIQTPVELQHATPVESRAYLSVQGRHSLDEQIEVGGRGTSSVRLCARPWSRGYRHRKPTAERPFLARSLALPQRRVRSRPQGKQVT
jgi:hypothetical protein